MLSIVLFHFAHLQEVSLLMKTWSWERRSSSLIFYKRVVHNLNPGIIKEIKYFGIGIRWTSENAKVKPFRLNELSTLLLNSTGKKSKLIISKLLQSFKKKKGELLNGHLKANSRACMWKPDI